MNSLKTPKFYRQRFLLILLEQMGGSLSKTDFQKLLFLAHKESGFKYYDFVPYHFGCYSFQAQSDIEYLKSVGWLGEQPKRINLLTKTKAFLKYEEINEIIEFTNNYKKLKGRKLLQHVYMNYPYYAIRSKVAHEVLDTYSYGVILNEKKKIAKTETVLYTIGYEGLSFEAYVNKLIINDIKLLCDVRKNPLSRKFGFSKGILSQLLPKFGIEYLHLPELGIPSELRRELNSPEDYKDLFNNYRKMLPDKIENLNVIVKLLYKFNRIALTCFEKDPNSCHRHCVSNYLEYSSNDFTTVHL